MGHFHLSGLAIETLRACLWLVLVTLIFVPLEFLFPAHRGEKLVRRSLLGDLGFFFVNSLLPQFLLVLPLALAAYVAWRFVPWQWRAEVGSWPIWLRGLLAFVIADLGFYWGHRWAHQAPFLWRFHAVHHDPKHVYFLISARAHPIDNAFIRLCGLIPIFILGLGAPQSVQGTMVATGIMLVLTLWGFFIHANVRWRFGPFEWLFATPAFHLWHHTQSGPRDRNFASMLPVWDWLFGTAYLPNEFPTDYGLDEPLPESLASQLIDPFLPAARPRAEAPPVGTTGKATLSVRTD